MQTPGDNRYKYDTDNEKDSNILWKNKTPYWNYQWEYSLLQELMKIVDEFRHLDGIKGGIALNEREYMATTILEEAEPLTQVIYSNFKEVVEQGQYVFDMLWNRAIPAK